MNTNENKEVGVILHLCSYLCHHLCSYLWTNSVDKFVDPSFHFVVQTIDQCFCSHPELSLFHDFYFLQYLQGIKPVHDDSI
jgi:hypothetical protein